MVLSNRSNPSQQKPTAPSVLGGIGGFGALYELPIDRYRRPVLVSGTDGVGTKLRLAIDSGIHHTVGVDLVAMCVNDILVLGAEPLYFLDYYATARLDPEVAKAVITGIVHGCELAGCALIGGETAELPGMYADKDYDLAGFCVGVVEKDQIIDASAVATGDVLIGLASSGPHSNGYSLIGKVLESSGKDLSFQLGNRTLGEILLEPTRIYVSSIRKTLENHPVNAMAHITGGGLTENLPASHSRGAARGGELVDVETSSGFRLVTENRWYRPGRGCTVRSTAVLGWCCVSRAIRPVKSCDSCRTTAKRSIRSGRSR